MCWPVRSAQAFDRGLWRTSDTSKTISQRPFGPLRPSGQIAKGTRSDPRVNVMRHRCGRGPALLKQVGIAL
jgi:hypothetical protein